MRFLLPPRRRNIYAKKARASNNTIDMFRQRLPFLIHLGHEIALTGEFYNLTLAFALSLTLTGGQTTYGPLLYV